MSVGLQMDAAPVENGLELPQEIQSGSTLRPSDGTPGYLSEEIQTIIQEDTFLPVFTAALFTKARIGKPVKCSSRDDWMRKSRYMHTVEYYSATKNEI